MEAPENLVDAVNRLKPRAILILDTNTLMENPRLGSYEINAPGLFLLIVPRIVVNELTSLRRGGKDEQTRRKALRACNVIDELYERGNPINGIHLGDDRWLITASSPRLPDPSRLDDEQVRRILGKGDDALRRLAEVCTEGCPGTSTLLVTRDRDLTRVAKSQGLSASPLPSLRSREALGEILDIRPGEKTDIDFNALLDPDEERPVQIATTLEELRSEGDDLVARGSGRLTYDERRFPFRWTFPYNMAVYKGFWTLDSHELSEMAMPLDNVDFMGADEEIPERVRDYVCQMLDDAVGPDGDGSLQSPLTRIRRWLPYFTGMGMMRGFDTLYDLAQQMQYLQEQGLSPEQMEKCQELMTEHNRHMQSLLDGTAASVGRAYRSVFQSSEALDDLQGREEDYDPENGIFDLDTSLIEFLDTALDTWSVGETREAEYTYYPWPEEEEEAVVDDEGELGAS